MKKIVALFVLSFLLLACGTNEKSQEKTADNSVVEVLNYNALEPLLNRKDDTTYVINFWATWCAPCIKELPYFEEALSHYRDSNVKVILVSLDFPDKLDSKLIPFIEKHKLKAEVILLDDPAENTWIPAIDQSWSGALPATLIYNKSKRSFFEQSFTKEELFNEINKFI